MADMIVASAEENLEVDIGFDINCQLDTEKDVETEADAEDLGRALNLLKYLSLDQEESVTSAATQEKQHSPHLPTPPERADTEPPRNMETSTWPVPPPVLTSVPPPVPISVLPPSTVHPQEPQDHNATTQPQPLDNHPTPAPIVAMVTDAEQNTQKEEVEAEDVSMVTRSTDVTNGVAREVAMVTEDNTAGGETVAMVTQEIQAGGELESKLEDEGITKDVISRLTTVKTQNDEDDFEFETAPSKEAVSFDMSEIESGLEDLERKLAGLEQEYRSGSAAHSSGSQDLQDLQDQQAQIQAEISTTQLYLTQLSSLVTMATDMPPMNPQHGRIHTWLSSVDQQLRTCQKVAQQRLMALQSVIRQQQTASASVADREGGGEEIPAEGGEDHVAMVTAAEEEWDAVQTITPGESPATRLEPIKLVLYLEVLEAAEDSFNLSQYESVIKTSVPRKGFSGFLHRLFGTKLHKSLHQEQKLVFCLAACPYQDDNPMHWKTLQTVYRGLTGSAVDCPRYGSHWEQIGFQGNDPATDLRGVGFLGLLNLLYLVTETDYSQLMKDMYRLSQHEIQNFPFCIMGINMSRIVIQALREDHLNKECNKRKSVFDVVNQFYVGTWLQMYTTWKTQHKTIRDTGYVMRAVEIDAKKRPHVTIASLNTHLAVLRTRSQGMGDGEGPLVFKAIRDLDPN